MGSLSVYKIPHKDNINSKCTSGSGGGGGGGVQGVQPPLEK